MILFICGFISGLLIATLVLIFKNKTKTYQCNGSIVMHEDELYLCLTKEDKKAFETARFATLRLEREKFNGFSE